MFSKKENDKKLFIGSKEVFTSTKFSFIINFLIIFILNFIFLLKYYPGNLTYDSFNEIEQIKGILPLMNNHSILHTAILGIFIKFGLLFKNINIGIFLFSLIQITIVSISFSYILFLLAKKNVPMIIRIISLLLFIHPINIFYSFSIWKDIPFSICFMFFTLLIYYLSKNDKFFNNKKNIIMFIITSLLVMYLRNNGVYVVILSFIIIYLLLRKTHTRLLPIFISIIITFFVSKIIIFNLLNINDFEVREILSLPSQSIARIYKNKKEELSKKDVILIEKFYSNKIGDVYNPIISDNTKGLLKQDYLLKHKSEYIFLNLRLFKRYSHEYLESFISNSYGYYYVNTDYPSIIIQKTDIDGVVHKQVFNNFVIYCIIVVLITLTMLFILWNLEDKKNILLFALLIPVLLVFNNELKINSLFNLIFNIGFYSLVLFILLIYNFKNKKNVIYYIPTIILWISILFSPVYSEFRYLYPMFISLPLFMGISFKKDNNI